MYRHYLLISLFKLTRYVAESYFCKISNHKKIVSYNYNYFKSTKRLFWPIDYTLEQSIRFAFAYTKWFVYDQRRQKHSIYPCGAQKRSPDYGGRRGVPRAVWNSRDRQKSCTATRGSNRSGAQKVVRPGAAFQKDHGVFGSECRISMAMAVCDHFFSNFYIEISVTTIYHDNNCCTIIDPFFFKSGAIILRWNTTFPTYVHRVQLTTDPRKKWLVFATPAVSETVRK